MAIQRISSDQISDGTVIAADIADGSVTGPKIGLTAINANNIVDGSITGPKLGAGALSSNNISAGSITGDKLGLTAINANNIVNGGVTVAKGGTGLSTLTANSVVLGNGTDPVQLIAPGTSGNVLTSNGTNWTSQAAAAGGGDYIMQVFTTPGTWTKPAGLKAVKVTVIGAGGNAGAGVSSCGFLGGGNGGGGGGAILYADAPTIPGPVAVTVGTAPSKTSSFGPLVSATGGTNGSAATPSLAAPTGPYAGGSGSGGTVNVTGESGIGNGGSPESRGGASGFGFGAGRSRVFNTAAVAGLNYGGGAISSGNISSPSGASGAGGIIIVEEFY